MLDLKNVYYFPGNVDVRACPKNCNTSIKQFFINITMKLNPNRKLKEEFFLFADTKVAWREQQVLNFGNQFDLPFRKNSIKMTIKRDPIDRFKSATEMFQSQVLGSNQEDILSKELKEFIIDKRYKKFYSSVDELLDDLENNNVVDGHFWPQTYYLGNNKARYDFVFDISEFRKFQENILALNQLEFSDYWIIHENYSNNSDIDKINELKKSHKKSRHIKQQRLFRKFNENEKITSRMTENEVKRIKKLYEIDYDNGWY